MITQAELKKKVFYDPVSGLFARYIVSRGAWVIAGTEDDGYIKIGVNKAQMYAHRLAWLYVHGVFPSVIDHINHNRSDNRICNLRSVSHRENKMNSPIQANSSSGITGVCWDKTNSKWVAQIRVEGINTKLGRFVCITAAAIARKAAEVRHGFHANHGTT